MLDQIIKCIVVAIVLYVVWVLLGLVLAGLLPALAMTLIGVVLVLVFCAFLLKTFGITL